MILHNQMTAVRDLGYILENQHSRLLLRVFLKWRELCREREWKEGLDSKLSELESRSAATLSEMNSQIQSLTQEAEERERQHSSSLQSARCSAALHSLQGLLASQRERRLERIFVRWLCLAKQRQLAAMTESYEQQLSETNSRVEEVVQIGSLNHSARPN